MDAKPRNTMHLGPLPSAKDGMKWTRGQTFVIDVFKLP